MFKKLRNKWNNADLSQKSSMLTSLIIFLLVIFIDIFWILDGISFTYRKDYIKKNQAFWVTADKNLIYPRSLKNDGITAEWGIPNDKIHFFFNKTPSPFNFTPIIFGLIILTVSITGGEGLVTGMKNMQLPKNTGTKLLDRDICRAWYLMICWGILIIGMVIIKRFLTDIDSITNTKIPIPEEYIWGGFMSVLITLKLSQIGASVSSTNSFIKELDKNKDVDKNE